MKRTREKLGPPSGSDSVAVAEAKAKAAAKAEVAADVMQPLEPPEVEIVEIYDVPLDSIVIDGANQRGSMDSDRLKELQDSLTMLGQMIPVAVTRPEKAGGS